MPRTGAHARPATYEGLLQVPDHLVGEILDGGVRALGAPTALK